MSETLTIDQPGVPLDPPLENDLKSAGLAVVSFRPTILALTQGTCFVGEFVIAPARVHSYRDS